MIRGWVEGGAALGLALALHLGAFAWAPEAPAALASGDGGVDLISLEAADASIAELVAEWDRPPELTPPELTPPADDSPEAPQPQADPPPTAQVTPDLPPVMAMAAPAPVLAPLPDLPQASPQSLPPPPAPPAPEPVAAPAPPPPEPVAAPPPPPEPVAAPAPPPPEPLARPAPRPKPPAVAKPPSAARAAQKAAGSGGGTAAGDRGAAQVATLSRARLDDLRAGWGAAIRARVERRKSYPADARGASGAVTVRLTVSGGGALVGVALAASSGNAALDQAALRAVQAAAPFPAAPAELPQGNQSFTLRMRYSR